jgi:large subunit ribosomal protein L4e
MHSLPVYDLNGEEKKRISLPGGFSEKVMPDLIRKAFLAEKSKERQPYGSDPLAGHRSSAHYHGRRGIRNSMMNREMARMKRIHEQGFLNMTARVVPQAVKGRRAHPPKVEKNWELKINKKERRKAMNSALAAMLDRDLVSKRGHRISGIKHVPLVIEDGFQKLVRTKDVVELLKKFGFDDEIKRCEKRKVRSGKGKARGRKYRVKRGPLVVIGKDEGVGKALENVQGVDVVLPKDLNVSLLAPGSHPGRLAIFTESAVKEMGS